MKYLLMPILLILTACQTVVPVRPVFPQPAPELMKKCEDLKKIEGKDKVAITEMLKVIVHNYSLYYECSTKVEGWQDWYNEQKKIYDNAK